MSDIYSPTYVPTPWLNAQPPPVFTPTHTPQDLSNQNQAVVNQITNDIQTKGPASDYGKVIPYPSFGEPFGGNNPKWTFAPGSNIAVGSDIGIAPWGSQPIMGGQNNQQIFNAPQYLAQNKDVWEAGADPWQHYNQFGQNENREGAWSNPNEVAWNGLAPANQGMDTFFNSAPTGIGGENDNMNELAASYYLGNKDVYAAAIASGQDPAAFAMNHLKNFGVGEGRTIFDANEYLRQNQDVAAAGANPFEHYRQFGEAEGRYAPMSDTFNPDTYRSYNKDVADAGVDPWTHYTTFGLQEGRQGAFGGDDDYDSRGDIMAAGEFPYGNPTGVGDSGYEGNGGYYGSAAENPWGAPLNSSVDNPSSYFVRNDPGTNPWQDTRSAFYNELINNPDRMYEAAVRGYLELKRDPEGRQGVFEAMYNQKAARPNLDPLRHDYFPHIVPGKDNTVAIRYLAELARTRETLRNDPVLLSKLYSELGRAYSSNVTQGATDWASGTVAANSANRTTETYKSPIEGERFFIKNIPNAYDGEAAGRANADWLQGIQQQLPDYKLPERFPR